MPYKDSVKQREFQRKWRAVKTTNETPTAKVIRLKRSRKANLKYYATSRGRFIRLIYNAFKRQKGVKGLFNPERVFQVIKFTTGKNRSFKSLVKEIKTKTKQEQIQFRMDVARFLFFLNKEIENDVSTDTD